VPIGARVEGSFNGFGLDDSGRERTNPQRDAERRGEFLDSDRPVPTSSAGSASTTARWRAWTQRTPSASTLAAVCEYPSIS
jgi:hypothetical protein